MSTIREIIYSSTNFLQLMKYKVIIIKNLFFKLVFYFILRSSNQFYQHANFIKSASAKVDLMNFMCEYEIALNTKE